ncbi:hypothetical protein [uncultured Roseovarius sp.]|uniref:hypothetical protein n=1 Tax=uncultured Roseovarius sp. TaxID=293344 RepID=UPI0026204B9F|nr:hypothetical protein [uncultured Roseovarius sp.]
MLASFTMGLFPFGQCRAANPGKIAPIFDAFPVWKQIVFCEKFINFEKSGPAARLIQPCTTFRWST